MQARTRNLLIIGIVILVGIIAAAAYSRRDSELAPTPSNPVVDQSVAAKEAVVAFGTKLKNVSLLAPDVTTAIDREYGAYVAPELLTAWKEKPEAAPGRLTSSPWPERIDAGAVTAAGQDTYDVEAHVIEAVQGGKELIETGSRRVTVTVQKRDGKWLIVGYEPADVTPEQPNTPSSGNDANNIPQTVTMSGSDVCLPHKDTSGPQTLECAIGLKTENGDYYALDLSGLSDNGTGANLGGQQQITVVGLLVPIEQISTDHWQKYDIKGIIKVEKLDQ